MKVINLKDLSRRDYQRIINRSAETSRLLIPEVTGLMEKVRKDGDRVIIDKYQKRFGKENYQSIAVNIREIESAYKEVNQEFIIAAKQMIKNITLVHKAQLSNKKEAIVTPEPGILVWQEWRSIEKVGIYVPGGKAIYPSSVLMTTIPAQIAGCQEIILCSPPVKNGQISSPTLVACHMIGIKKIFKVGGIEAIAAMAYGTATIPKVYKIFGAGNPYVTCAKMLALGDVAIDMPAGPSEVFIIADRTANPSWIAADLIADGEHGEDSACVLLTTSYKVAGETANEIRKQLAVLPTKDRAAKSLRRYGLIAVVDSFEEAIDFTNEYAPEHLEIMTKNSQELVAKITNAGSVFLGSFSTKSSGDYATGANHVLPTGGFAKMYSPLAVDSFGKWMQVQKCTKAGLTRIRKTIETVAKIEQLPAHKLATSIRFGKTSSSPSPSRRRNKSPSPYRRGSG